MVSSIFLTPSLSVDVSSFVDSLAVDSSGGGGGGGGGWDSGAGGGFEATCLRASAASILACNNSLFWQIIY